MERHTRAAAGAVFAAERVQRIFAALAVCAQGRGTLNAEYPRAGHIPSVARKRGGYSYALGRVPA